MSKGIEESSSVAGGESRSGWDGTARIFCVEEGLAFEGALVSVLAEEGCEVRGYSSRHALYKDLASQGCDLLMIGSGRDERRALELVRETKRAYPLMPVLLLVRESDLCLVIEAMRAGVFDVIKEPFDAKLVLRTVLSALGRCRSRRGGVTKELLTGREAQVLKLIGDGKGNKDIAELLRISVRTVEFHRGRIMRKLGVEHFAGLIKKAISLGLTSLDRPVADGCESELESGDYLWTH